MKKFLFVIILMISCYASYAQITASDMPTSGDTLRSSFANPIGSTINLSNTGSGITWDFSTLTPIAQVVDVYKTAFQVNPLYAATISLNAYGYKVADSIPGASAFPVTINDIYTFFSKKNNPSRFVAEAFAAKVSNIPTAVNYSDEDEWYFFPLNYTDVDSSTFKLNFTMGSVGSYKQQGKRKTTVDGQGTIKTPFFTMPTSCIRVKSEVDAVDSVSFGTQSFGIPRKTIEYKWLVSGEHFPALWVTANVLGTQTFITSVRYRDMYRLILGITAPDNPIQILTAYPNPATDAVTIKLPQHWRLFTLEVFDTQGKLVSFSENNARIDISSLSTGQYIIRVSSGSEIGYVQILK